MDAVVPVAPVVALPPLVVGDCVTWLLLELLDTACVLVLVPPPHENVTTATTVTTASTKARVKAIRRTLLLRFSDFSLHETANGSRPKLMRRVLM